MDAVTLSYVESLFRGIADKLSDLEFTSSGKWIRPVIESEVTAIDEAISSGILDNLTVRRLVVDIERFFVDVKTVDGMLQALDAASREVEAALSQKDKPSLQA